MTTHAIVRALRDAAQADWTNRDNDIHQEPGVQGGIAIGWDRAIRVVEEAVAKGEETTRLRAMQMNAELPPEQAATLHLKGMIG